MKEESAEKKDSVIRTDIPVKERLRDYIRQGKDPYSFTSNGVTVKISFSGTKRLEDCLLEYFS